MDDARRFDFVAVEVAGGVLGEVPGQDEDAVERRAQFVRHVGQELRLVAVGLGEFACARLGLAAAEFELPSLRFETAVFLCQFFALYPQLLLGGQKFAVLDLELFGLTTHFVAQRLHFGVSLGEFGFLSAELLGLPATVLKQREIAFGSLDVCQMQPQRAD
jgi:hypothetical protein